MQPWAPQHADGAASVALARASHTQVSLAQCGAAAGVSHARYNVTRLDRSKHQQLVDRFDAMLADTHSKLQRLKAIASVPGRGPAEQATEKPHAANRGAAAAATAGTTRIAEDTMAPHSSRHAALQRKLDVYRSDPKALAQLRDSVYAQQQVRRTSMQAACPCTRLALRTATR